MLFSCYITNMKEKNISGEHACWTYWFVCLQKAKVLIKRKQLLYLHKYGATLLIFSIKIICLLYAQGYSVTFLFKYKNPTFTKK